MTFSSHRRATNFTGHHHPMGADATRLRHTSVVSNLTAHPVGSVTTFSAFTAFRLAKMQSTLIEAQRKRKRVLHGGIHHASTCNYERDDIVFFTRDKKQLR